MQRTLRILGALIVCLTIAHSAFAQGGRSEISGTIVDAGKAVLPGSTVTATNEATGLARNTVTDAGGKFTIAQLLPGTYTVSAELSGFQTAKHTGLILAVGQTLSVSLTLEIASVKETVTVTGQTPLVEVTSSQVGTSISNTEIDGLPSANRSQFSLMQTVPGLVPVLQVGSFEGGQFSANGQSTTNNLFLVDGQADNDSRRGGSQGTQARISLDTMAEYQVETHNYGAEYGGSTGVVVNGVTKSGTNSVHGRVFEYWQSNKIEATDYFVKINGDDKPESGSNVFGGSIGGPIVRNKLFYFFNYEGTAASEGATLEFPANAAPLATSYSTTTKFHGPNTFFRLDYQPSGSQQFKFSWLREAIVTERDSIEDDKAILDAARAENDAGDIVYSGSWTSVISNRMTNELKFGHVEETLLQGPDSLFDSNWGFLGFSSGDPFSSGSQNTHPDYIAANRNTYTADHIRDWNVDDQMVWLKSGWAGEHTFKFGGGWSKNAAVPLGSGANFIGLITFPTNVPFNQANPATYPFRFGIAVGQINFTQVDHRYNGYISDKWQVSRRLTVNWGVRYDYQLATPNTKDAIGPRFGVAYDLFGNGRTLLRGGFGKVYQYQQLAILTTLEQRAVISPTLAYDTGQVTSPATSGVLPIKVGDPNATACLNVVAGPTAGEAVMSPACINYLTGLRNQVLAGGYVNNSTTGPVADGDRHMAYTWAFSAGVKHQVANNLAISADYVGNRGKDNTGVVDINEGPVNPATGKVTRLGVNVFDPNGELVPPQARNTTFVQFNQEQTKELGSALDSTFNSLELGLEKRMSHRWSGRVSYTYSKCYDDAIAAFTVDPDPHVDYGRCDRDNTHAFSSSVNLDLTHGFGAGFVFRAYSGYPITETTGVDTNGDGTTNDRPTAGVDDKTRPIVSPLDSRGVAIRNGINGEHKVILDGRFQYIHRFGKYEGGIFIEIYNLTNHVNYGNATGARNSSNFLIPTTADNPRQGQIGFRLTF